MPTLRAPARLPLLLCLMLAGCLRTPGIVESTAPQPLSTIALPTSPAEPLPEVAFSDLVVRPGEREEAWVVLGMARNRSSSALLSPAVRVELLDAAGQKTGETTSPLPLPILPPGAASPFVARLESVTPPAEARASLDTYQFSYEPSPILSPGPVDVTLAAQGVYVRGLVGNDGPAAARALAVVVSWRDASRSLMGVTAASMPSAIVDPGESLPWMALASDATTRSRFEVYIAASAADIGEAPSLALADAPSLRLTSQGKAFVTGSIRNTGSQPLLPEVAVALSRASMPVGLAILRTDVPLPPGETLPFAVDEFPGLAAALDSAEPDPAALTVDVYLNGRVPSGSPAPVPLPLSIVQAEAIGSNLFLRGSLSPSTSVPLYRAAVFIVLRSIAGETLSARWLVLPLPQNELGVSFTADLPLPAGVDPALCEYDVRAFGLTSPLPSQ